MFWPQQRASTAHQRLDCVQPAMGQGSSELLPTTSACLQECRRGGGSPDEVHFLQEPVANVSSPSQPAAQAARVEKVEERAMSLHLLRHVKRVVLSSCIEEGWSDSRTDTKLQPSEVNLYHLAYYHLWPQTVPEGVLLRGRPAHPRRGPS